MTEWVVAPCKRWETQMQRMVFCVDKASEMIELAGWEVTHSLFR